MDNKKPEIKAIGFVLANQNSKLPLKSFAVTVDSVEALTGIDFFADLPDSLEELLESSIDIDKWFYSPTNHILK